MKVTPNKVSGKIMLKRQWLLWSPYGIITTCKKGEKICKNI